MEAQTFLGNIQRNTYMDLKVFPNTTYGPCVLDEYQNIMKCQSHISKFHFPRKNIEPEEN